MDMIGAAGTDGQSSLDPQISKTRNDNGDQFARLKRWCLHDLEKTRKWRATAREEFAFITGQDGQWTPEEIQKLTDEGRPVITFNKTLKFVRAVCGVEANNRQDIIYMPRDITNIGAVKANEMLSVGAQWMSDGCDAPRQQSRTFRDQVICGMGWTEATIEYDIDPRGAYVERRTDPLEMFWDTTSRDANITSSKRRGRARRMTLEDARALIPGVTDDINKFSDADLDASWASSLTESKSPDPKTQQEKEQREENSEEYDDDTEVTVVQIQWWEYEPYFRTVNPQDPSKTVDVDADKMAQLEAAYGAPIPKSKLRRRVYKEAIIGGDILYIGPCKRGDGFTFNCATWEPDDKTGMWFGLVRGLRDPQQWSNKFFAQLMHMMNTTAKGGIMAEEGAFSDVRQAEQTLARTDKITVVARNALQNGSIQPKPGSAITGGVIALSEMADQAFTDVSGINLELLGLADRDQAGVLEAQRKQAAMTILATLFDGYGGFHRDVGGCRLYFLQNYLADDRLIRIDGTDGPQAIQLLKDKTLGRYDVIVGENPSSPNAKERVWATLQPFMPEIVQNRPLLVATMDYMPNVPSKLIETFKKVLSAPPPQQALDKMQRDADAETASTAKDNALANQATATAALNVAKAGVEHSAQAAADFANLLQAASAARLNRLGLMPALDTPIMGNAPQVFGRPQLPAPAQAPAAPTPAAIPPPAALPAPQAQSNIVAPGGI